MIGVCLAGSAYSVQAPIALDIARHTQGIRTTNLPPAPPFVCAAVVSNVASGEATIARTQTWTFNILCIPDLGSGECRSPIY